MVVGGGGSAFNIRGKGLLGELGGLSRGFFLGGTVLLVCFRRVPVMTVEGSWRAGLNNQPRIVRVSLFWGRGCRV